MPVRETRLGDAGSGGMAVTAQSCAPTKTQEFDDFLNYEVALPVVAVD